MVSTILARVPKAAAAAFLDNGIQTIRDTFLQPSANISDSIK